MSMDFQLYLEQLRRDASPRPHYGFIVLNAAVLAKALGRNAITVIEFGVAKGAGLTVMENHAMIIESCTGVRIDVVGFDNGTGLPDHRRDYRDAPHVWQPGMFRMDETELRSRLTRATLVLGDVAGTVAEFCRRSVRQTPALWNQRIAVHHDFAHPDYTTHVPQEEYKPLF